MYESLTVFLEPLQNESSGEWIVDKTSKGTTDDPIQMPFVAFSKNNHRFIEAVYAFEDEHPDLGLKRYSDILEENGLSWSSKSMETTDVSLLDGRCVVALILGSIRFDRFCEGYLKDMIDSGFVAKWLFRLKEIDDTSSM